MAVATNRQYPLKGEQPLWLRIEHQRWKWDGFSKDNDESNKKQAAIMMEKASEAMVRARRSLGMECPSGPMLCEAPWGTCTDKCCKAFKHTPIVHVPHFHHQFPTGNDTAGWLPKEAKLHEEDTAWENWRSCSSRDPHAASVLQGSSASTGAGTYACASEDAGATALLVEPEVAVATALPPAQMEATATAVAGLPEPVPASKKKSKANKISSDFQKDLPC
eukprot:TRINITY_DN21529_c2_g1_i2.p1 TRINITY_DN21529_c2_g1~~TRINITY_DN21529_c2_g1_i2.p1  ORF type:complete len:220 (-),score=27.66 TRINITY_DN21529_c2_g1_i2:168-827(-)